MFKLNPGVYWWPLGKKIRTCSEIRMPLPKVKPFQGLGFRVLTLEP